MRATNFLSMFKSKSVRRNAISLAEPAETIPQSVASDAAATVSTSPGAATVSTSPAAATVSTPPAAATVSTSPRPSVERDASYRRSTVTGFQKTKFDLNSCVECIESILEKSTAVTTLSREQVTAINILREKIIQSVEASAEVADKSKSSELLVPAGVMDDLTSVENQFIATHYGGVNLDDHCDGDVQRDPKSKRVTLSAFSGRSTIASMKGLQSAGEMRVQSAGEMRMKSVNIPDFIEEEEEEDDELSDDEEVHPYDRNRRTSYGRVQSTEDSDDEEEEVLVKTKGRGSITLFSKRASIDTLPGNSTRNSLLPSSLEDEDDDDGEKMEIDFSMEETFFMPDEWKKLRMEAKTRLAKQLSWENISRWDFDITKIVEDTERDGVSCPLFMVGWAILGSPHAQKTMAFSLGTECNSTDFGYNFNERLDEEEDKSNLHMQTLCAFLREVEKNYKHDNPYHNNTHAADVVQTTHSLIQMGPDSLRIHDAYFMLMAAVVHDVGHPGTNNLYHVKAQTDLALQFNDVSVLENHHASTAFQMLKGAKMIKGIDVLEGLEKQVATEVRSKMIKAVLSTDMSSHFAHVSSIESTVSSLVAQNATLADLLQPKTDDEEKMLQEVLNFIIHLADISNPTKPMPIAAFWADSALAEFFAQGDKEAELGLPISPLCDRKTTTRGASQRGFILFVVLPAFELLGKLIPEVAETVLPIIHSNVEYWDKIIKEEKGE